MALDYTSSDALDRFGRIADHAWKKDGVDVVRIQHGYDVTGNRLNRQDTVSSSWSESYSYDNMDQIATMDRTGHSESWQYDPTGNWMSYNKNNVIESRTHDTANEILTGVVHDANGNMIQMASPKDGSALSCVYDAWNRLVAVGNNIRYEYSGLNHRIAKTVENIRTESFFSEKWQELENRTNDETATYVWGQRYVDDLVYRESDGEKLYFVADPNWNVVATVDEDGDVVERFQYDAFGKVSGLTSDWDRTFTGQVLDHETGLMLYRNRYYQSGLGRFVSRDPIGYEADSQNLYRYSENSPQKFTDFNGFGPSIARQQECCNDSIVLRIKDDTTWAMPVCCDGTKISCIFDNDLYPNPKSECHRVIRRCIDAHEIRHYPDSESCPPCGITVARWRPGKNSGNSECVAYKAELNCLKKLVVRRKPCIALVKAHYNKTVRTANNHYNCGFKEVS